MNGGSTLRKNQTLNHCMFTYVNNTTDIDVLVLLIYQTLIHSCQTALLISSHHSIFTCHLLADGY